MITEQEQRTSPNLYSALSILVERLNGPLHEKALWVYMAIVLGHWIEHLYQAYQIYVLHWPLEEALGALGLVSPWLVESEALHFGYAVFMLAGLIILRPAFLGRSRIWWNISLGIQTWHFFEHALLQGQAILGQNLFNSPVPSSLAQVWIPRVELHLIYNGLVFLPMVIAMFYHKYPPRGDQIAHSPACTCSS